MRGSFGGTMEMRCLENFFISNMCLLTPPYSSKIVPAQIFKANSPKMGNVKKMFYLQRVEIFDKFDM